MFKWIDVREALPEDSGYVLVATTSGSVQSTFFCDYPNYFAFLGDIYVEGHNRYFELAVRYGYQISHWAELPMAPATQKGMSGYRFMYTTSRLNIADVSFAIDMADRLQRNPFILEGADYSGH